MFFIFPFTLDQADTDGDNIGDVCDNCPSVSNAAQTDVNENGIGDSCDGNDKYVLVVGKSWTIRQTEYLFPHFLGAGVYSFTLVRVSVPHNFFCQFSEQLLITGA